LTNGFSNLKFSAKANPKFSMMKGGYVMNRKNNNIKKKIGEYCYLDTQIKELQARQKQLRAEFEEIPLAAGTYYATHDGKKYELVVGENERVEYDPLKVATRLPKKELVKVIKVTSAVKKFFLPAELNKLIKKVTTYYQYRVKEVK